MQLFYSAQFIDNSTCLISGQEHIHLSKTLRLKEGDKTNITNGKGGLFNAHILSIKKRETLLKVSLEYEQSKPKSSVSIAIAPTKNINRFEWFLEKAVEIGVERVYPMFTQYTERKTIKLERLERIMIAAMKQSNRLFLPKLYNIDKFDNILLEMNECSEKLIAYTDEHTENFVLKQLKAINKTCIFIGPEGGFSKNELKQAKENGFVSVSLGNARLRSETAGVVALTLLNSLVK